MEKLERFNKVIEKIRALEDFEEGKRIEFGMINCYVDREYYSIAYDEYDVSVYDDHFSGIENEALEERLFDFDFDTWMSGVEAEIAKF